MACVTLHFVVVILVLHLPLCNNMQAFFHAAVLLGRGTAAGLMDIDTTFAEFYACVVASGWDVTDVCITDGLWRCQWNLDS
jgi:hypothetical protein